MSRKPVGIMVAPDERELLPKLRERTHRTYAEMLAEGLKIVAENPRMIRDLAEYEHGVGKKLKVFNLPLEVDGMLVKLADNTSKSHVFRVALRAFADCIEAGPEHDTGLGRHTASMLSDDALIEEVLRRGLGKKVLDQIVAK